MKKKQITVAYTNRETSSGWITVPKIQTEGLWLEKLGYNIGDKIILEYDETGIRIRPMTATEKIECRQKELEAEIHRCQKELKAIQDVAAEEIAQLAIVAEDQENYSSVTQPSQ